MILHTAMQSGNCGHTTIGVIAILMGNASCVGLGAEMPLRIHTLQGATIRTLLGQYLTESIRRVSSHITTRIRHREQLIKRVISKLR